MIHPFVTAEIYRFFAVIERPDGFYRVESPIDYEKLELPALLAEMLASYEQLKADKRLSAVGELMLAEMEAALAGK